MLSSILIISFIALLVVYECEAGEVDMIEMFRRAKLGEHKLNERKIPMRKEDLEKVLAKMVNRYNGVSSPFKVRKIMPKLKPENSSAATEIMKPNDQVEEQTIAKMIIKKFNNYWKSAVDNFYSNIKYKVVTGSDGKIYSMPVADRSHFFIG
jgi:hypothetical protein